MKKTIIIYDILSSSDDDEKPLLKTEKNEESDDEPLVRIATTKSLRKYSEQKCDFCDAVFVCRYDMLLHNASHIIIPLLKQSLVQCNECLFYFASQADLETHRLRKHYKVKNISPLELSTILTSIVRKQPLVKCYDDKLIASKCVANCVTTDNCDVIEEPLKSECNGIKSELSNGDIKEAIKNELRNGIKKPDTNKQKSVTSLKNRIVFEDDASSNEESHSISYISTINLQTFEVNNDNVISISSDDDDTESHNASDMPTKTLLGSRKPEEVYVDSVHYDELVVPGIFRCRRCVQCFPTRYELITHEPIHMKSKRMKPMLCCVCERFIAGNHYSLKKHMERKHPDSIPRTLVQHCIRCGLRYSHYLKHVKNYHQIYVCNQCGKGFEDDITRNEHMKSHTMGKIVKICNLCYSFLKNRTNCHYYLIGEVQEMGVRQTCERCNNLFFEVKQVKLIYNKPLERKKHNLKHVSNTDRLKKIRKRLKLLNTVRRLQCVVVLFRFKYVHKSYLMILVSKRLAAYSNSLSLAAV